MLSSASNRCNESTPSISHRSVPAPNKLTGLRVLLVEDDLDQLALLSEILSHAGAEVDAVTSAREAMSTLGQRIPDVIVSDISLPDSDGYRLLRMVRARSRQDGGSTPAIALTGSVTPAERTRALLASYQMHLAKPTRSAELIAAIRSLADAHSRAAT